MVVLLLKTDNLCCGVVFMILPKGSCQKALERKLQSSGFQGFQNHISMMCISSLNAHRIKQQRARENK
jgi:hypothetical protein